MGAIGLVSNVEVVEPGRDAVDGYRQLAAAVLLQALYDARQRKDPAEKLSAILFITSKECLGLCEILGLPDPVRALYQRGELRGYRARNGGWRKKLGKRSEQQL